VPLRYLFGIGGGETGKGKVSNKKGKS
jgi:hypothetical protein